MTKIHPSRFSLADSNRNVWSIVPEVGTPYSALSDASYWSHIADKLRPFDRIEVYAEDGAYWAELLVISAARLSAKVIELRKKDLDGVGMVSEPGFEVQWKGPHHKHAVVRMKDKTALQSGFASKEDAMAWLASNSKTLAA